jgi:hypothetical protein
VKKEEKMRSKFAILLAIAGVCVTTALAGWSPEEQVTKNKSSNDLRLNNGHKTVVATNGVKHLVWFTSSGVFYKRCYPGSGWTSDYQLTTIKNSWMPSIALDANGTGIHVVWSGAGAGRKDHKHIYYQKCVPGTSGNGGWVGTPRDISGEAPGRDNESPSVACYQGHVVVTWPTLYSDSVGFCECVDGNWGLPFYFVDPAGYPAMDWNPSIAVDPQDRYGDAFISYYVTSSPSGGGYVIRRQNGEWQPRELAAGGVSYPCIEVDPGTGYPHIACRVLNNMGIYHTYWDPSLGWRPLEMISDRSADAWGGPSAIFSGSSAFVVWPELSSSNVPGIMYSVGQYGNWTPPDWVTSGYSDQWPSVTARSNGDVYVVWRDGRASNNQIWGRLYTPGSGGGQAQPTAPAQSRIELFPNPAKAGRVTVQYSLPRVEPVRVTLLDVSGRAVSSQVVAATDRSGSFSIDVSGLSAGVYVARLVAGDLSVSKSLVVGR